MRSTDRPVVSGMRVVSEAHLLATLGTFRLLIEGASAWENRSRDADGNPTTPREPLPTMQFARLVAELSWVIRGQQRLGDLWPQDEGPAGGWNGGAVEVAGRFERLWLGQNASDITPGGAVGAAAAVRWWISGFFGLGLAGYLLHYDVAPLEQPMQLVSWLVTARATVRFR